VLCGNALDQAAYTALMQDDRAKMVFADPPYNVPIEGNVSGLGAVHHREFMMASGEMNEAESLYRSQHELVFVFKQRGQAHRNNVQLGQYGRNRSNLWHYPGANSFSRSSAEGNLLAVHPTVKPVGLVADAILDCTSRRDIVLDSFLGQAIGVGAGDIARKHRRVRDIRRGSLRLVYRQLAEENTRGRCPP